MTERALSSYYPAELQRILPGRLPGHPTVLVTPLDKKGRRCPSWCAADYELQAFYVSSSFLLLDALEDAVCGLDGVYRTTRKAAGDALDDSNWPRKHRDPAALRPQVLALIACGRDTPRATPSV